MNKKETRKIAFFFPGYKFGGVEFLYTRIALQLVQNGYKIEIIDYSDGTLISNLLKQTKGVNLVEYKKGESFMSDSDVCITSLKYLPHAKNIFPKDLKLIFWDEHPYNLIHFLSYARLFKWFGHNSFILFSYFFNYKKVAYCKKILNTALLKNGVAFMCYYNYLINKEYFGINHSPYYVPIPIISKQGKWERKLQPNIINCSYLGRLDSDKYKHCLELMHDILRFNINNDSKLRLHIIGDGDRFKTIRQLAEKYPDYFILKGIITGCDLNNYLLNNIDLSFAVGTSALESAVLAIPTIYMRGLNSRLKNKYLWVFDAKYYELGLQLFHFKEYNETVFLLEQIITQLKSDSILFGEKCYTYVKNNHCMDSTINKLKFFIENSQLKIDDL